MSVYPYLPILTGYTHVLPTVPTRLPGGLPPSAEPLKQRDMPHGKDKVDGKDKVGGHVDKVQVGAAHVVGRCRWGPC